MAYTPLPMMTQQQFAERTKSVEKRGPISVINWWLEEWQTLVTYLPPGHNERILVLNSILRASYQLVTGGQVQTRWVRTAPSAPRGGFLSSHRRGPSGQQAAKARVIGTAQEVLKSAWDWYKYEHYHKHKREQPRYTGGMALKGLSGAYRHEAPEVYNPGTRLLQGGRLIAPTKGTPRLAGSTVKDFFKLKGINKSFSQMDLWEYKNLEEEAIRSGYVEGKYKQMKQYTKKERIISHLLINLDDRLYITPFEVFETGYDSRDWFTGYEQWMYALDEYGNLYSAPGMPGVEHHSSFVRGKPVICAGMISLDSGKIMYIDNNSGHYIPQPDKLQNALRVLQRSGLLDSIIGISVSIPNPLKSESRESVFGWIQANLNRVPKVSQPYMEPDFIKSCPTMVKYYKDAPYDVSTFMNNVNAPAQYVDFSP